MQVCLAGYEAWIIWRHSLIVALPTNLIGWSAAPHTICTAVQNFPNVPRATEILLS